MRAKRSRVGVTLIELVVVIALIGIMAGVVAPNLVSRDRRAADQSAVDCLDGVVRFARARAIDRGGRVDLVIDPATNRFWLDLADTSGAIDLPEGATLVSPARRVHVHIEPTGEAYIDEPLFVRQGETIGAVHVDP